MDLLSYFIDIDIPKLYETEDVTLLERSIYCVFTNPKNNEKRYILEGEIHKGILILYGLVDNHDQEFCYFPSSEINNYRLSYCSNHRLNTENSSLKIRNILLQ